MRLPPAAQAESVPLPCARNFSVVARSVIWCSFEGEVNGEAYYELNSSVQVNASIVAPAYLNEFNASASGRYYALASGSGSGVVLVGVLYDTNVALYYLAVQNSGDQSASVSFLSYGFRAPYPPPYGVAQANATILGKSSWCLPLPASSLTTILDVMGAANTSVAYSVINSSGTVFQAPYATSTNVTGPNSWWEYGLLLAPGSYTLRIANAAPYPAFVANQIQLRAEATNQILTPFNGTVPGGGLCTIPASSAATSVSPVTTSATETLPSMSTPTSSSKAVAQSSSPTSQFSTSSPSVRTQPLGFVAMVTAVALVAAAAFVIWRRR